MKVGGGKWSWVEVAARFVVVMVISFRCYWYSGSASLPPPPLPPRVPIVGVPATSGGRWDQGDGGY